MPRSWIIDPEARTVRQYEHRGSRFEEVALLRSGDLLSSPLFPPLTLSVADLFQELRAQGG